MLSRFAKSQKLKLKRRKPAGSQKIFCIGLQKTGTTTFQKCMETLGYDHKGNSPEIFAEWRRGNKSALFDIIEKYDSFDDVPYFILYKEIFAKYGASARYVLTLRSSPEVWLESVKAHAIRRRPSKTFDSIYGYAYPHGYEDKFIEVYNSHQDGVRQFFHEHGASESLCELCWENGDGWNELCRFLGKSIPAAPFPHARQRSAPDPARELENMTRINHQMLNAIFSRLRASGDNSD